MTQTRTFLAFIAVVAAFGALAAFLLPAQQPTAQAAVPAVTDVHRIDAIPAVQAADLPQVDELVARTLAAHVGDTAYTTTQSIEAHLAADRVCEAMIAGVPLMEIADATAAQQGLTDEEAHDFVIAAHEINCPAF